ncbi:aldehyde dehydrogenase family protein [Alginatibacterium sediminis]|uniref:Aldehyde dehydrogenase family protein n=1 Tax=Alginatibacterium sediminis TaxID=2164068 RepID=A0A420EB92_9ALTE|nr:aldehyde dehydrogenase family protein [Alginatibacterium sediminis]RKF17924.1 aldehyde dehydrogenase family protein [Alginatibacterium sediminis]
MLIEKMYLDGQAFESGETCDVINPATDKVVAAIQVANLDVAQKALNSAKAAEKSWSKTSIAERVSWMKKLRAALLEREDDLRMCVHLEAGKTWDGTQEDFDLLVNSLEFYAEEIQRYQPSQLQDTQSKAVHTLNYRPVGVVVAYLSWNFPLLNLSYKLGPAMATGCPIILKPSVQSPLSAYLVGSICQEIGLPAGAVTIIAGGNRDVSDLISGSKIPSMLTLIGSIATGVKIMQAGATSIKRYSMELGGNTPFVVFKDADLDKAADILCALKYGNSGQICVAPNRVFVDEAVHAQFLAKILDKTKQVKLGFGRDSDATMGPVISKSARAGIHKLVVDALEQGAQLQAGGSFDEDAVGAFYPPTVLSHVDESMDIYQHEIFGPVISIISFSDEQKVIEQVNDTDTGLASYIFSEDINKAQLVAAQFEFGEIQINGVQYAINLPHVGIKQSGIGCDCSKYALDDYLYLTRTSRTL